MNIKYKFHQIIRQSILVIVLCFLLASCQNVKNKGAIIYSFDDQYVDEWFAQRELFNKYNIKATFFINRPHLLTPNQVEKLNILQKDGHEIGCHGLNHLNVTKYKDSIDILIQKEIKPAIKILADVGFKTTSFAHPYGQSLPEINTELLKHFDFLRMATWNMRDTTIDFYNEIFANANNYQVTNSMGIDSNYGISLQSFEKGLLRAIERKEVLILHAHKTDSSLTNYTVSPDYLESTFLLCKKHNIAAIRISDLKKYFSQE